MNIYAVIILVVLLARFALSLAANLLNLKSLTPEPPEELAGVYKPEDYRRSQQYLRVSTRFGMIESVFSLCLLLVFWFAGGFDFLDRVVRAWGFIPLVNGLLYTGIIGLGYSLITLPFGIYDTFVIEQRFGFNRTTPRTFILDELKGFALAVALGGPLLAAILALFQYAGSYAWVYCWAAVVVFTLAVQYIAPTWIMPLFNKFTPLPPGELRDAILGYARSVEFPLQNIFVMDGSKRSSKSNAFFTGFGRNRRIALFDTLIAAHTVPEMTSVIAHEVGHYKKKHILIGTVVSILHAGLLLYLLSLFMDSAGLYHAFFMSNESIYTGLIFFSLLYTPIETVLSVLMHLLSRRHEYQADRFAADTTLQPQSMIDALKKLHANNLSNLTPHPFYVFMGYSHPTLLQRVRAIKAAAKQTSV